MTFMCDNVHICTYSMQLEVPGGYLCPRWYIIAFQMGPIRGHFCRPRRPRRLSLACRPSPCMRTAPPDRRRPSEGMYGGVEAAGMGDDRRRGKITLERPQGVLM